MTTSYITPAMLTSAPAGIAWTVVPTLTPDFLAQAAQLADVCRKATSILDTYCRQPLRATVNTEAEVGPGGGRVSADRDSGAGTAIARRWPVTSVLAVQTSPARTFPPAWTPVPSGLYAPRRPLISSAGISPPSGPDGGSAIDIAPGYVTHQYGRRGLRVQYSYISGYPHAGITAAATGDTPELSVDDVTGWAGFSGWIYDGTATELITVLSVEAANPVELPGGAGLAQAGPGVLTLAGPLADGHATGTCVSALPESAIHAAVLAATVQALQGINAIAMQSLSGITAGGTASLAEECELILDDYRRVV